MSVNRCVDCKHEGKQQRLRRKRTKLLLTKPRLFCLSFLPLSSLSASLLLFLRHPRLFYLFFTVRVIHTVLSFPWMTMTCDGCDCIWTKTNRRSFRYFVKKIAIYPFRGCFTFFFTMRALSVNITHDVSGWCVDEELPRGVRDRPNVTVDHSTLLPKNTAIRPNHFATWVLQLLTRLFSFFLATWSTPLLVYPSDNCLSSAWLFSNSKKKQG